MIGIRSSRLVASIVLTLASVVEAADPSATELTLTKLNRVYEDVAGEAPPYVFDPVTVTLRSEHQKVVLKDNRVRLTPLGGDRFAGRIELDLLGMGDLTADVDVGGRSQRFRDELLLPPQTVAVEGEVRLARTDGGYRVTIVELPEEVPVTIRSRLVGQVLETCAGAALLTLGALDCEPMAEALEHPKVPLPEPGSELFLADTDLTAENRAALDALLARR